MNSSNGYNYDQHLITRLRLLDFAEQVKLKSEELNHGLPGDRVTDDYKTLAYYNDNSWVKALQLRDGSLSNNNQYNKKEII